MAKNNKFKSMPKEAKEAGKDFYDVKSKQLQCATCEEYLTAYMRAAWVRGIGMGNVWVLTAWPVTPRSS